MNADNDNWELNQLMDAMNYWMLISDAVKMTCGIWNIDVCNLMTFNLTDFAACPSCGADNETVLHILRDCTEMIAKLGAWFFNQPKKAIPVFINLKAAKFKMSFGDLHVDSEYKLVLIGTLNSYSIELL